MMPSRPTFKLLFVALALCACARSAPSAVTAVDIVPDLVMNTFNVQFNVDLDNNGFADVWFIRSPISTNGLIAFSTADVRIQAVPSDVSTRNAWPITAGTLIGSSAVSPADWYFSAAPFGYLLATGPVIVGSSVVQGGYFPGMDAYIGVEMTLPDGIHYGYINVSVQNLTSIGTLKSYGFETTPGVPIIAGATPEPGRMALLLMAFGAGWLHRRRWVGR